MHRAFSAEIRCRHCRWKAIQPDLNISLKGANVSWMDTPDHGLRWNVGNIFSIIVH